MLKRRGRQICGKFMKSETMKMKNNNRLKRRGPTNKKIGEIKMQINEKKSLNMKKVRIGIYKHILKGGYSSMTWMSL